jgi:hypothetical protein
MPTESGMQPLTWLAFARPPKAGLRQPHSQSR